MFGKCKDENFVLKINGVEVFSSSIEFYAQRELNWKLGILRDELRAAETPKSRSNNILLGSIANFDYTQFTNAIRIRKEIKKLEKRLVKCT